MGDRSVLPGMLFQVFHDQSTDLYSFNYGGVLVSLASLLMTIPVFSVRQSTPALDCGGVLKILVYIYLVNILS